MDAAVTLAIVIIVASCAAIFSGDVIGWMRDEWKRLNASSWAPPHSNSYESEGVQRTLRRLHQAKVNMRARGTKLLIEDREPYQRVITAKDNAPPPKADRVVPIRRRPH